MVLRENHCNIDRDKIKNKVKELINNKFQYLYISLKLPNVDLELKRGTCISFIQGVSLLNKKRLSNNIY